MAGSLQCIEGSSKPSSYFCALVLTRIVVFYFAISTDEDAIIHPEQRNAGRQALAIRFSHS